MRELFNVRSIPRYVIIDQEGRVVNANAPRPKSHKGDIVNKELLEELKSYYEK